MTSENALPSLGEKGSNPKELVDVKRSRVEMCGKVWSTGVRRDNGQYRQFPFNCDQWRECPLCLEKRARKFHSKIQKTIADNPSAEVYYVELDPDDAMELARELGNKKLYLRMPMIDGSEAVFYFPQTEEQRDMGLKLTLKNTDDGETLDWHKIVMTPKRRRTSGSLGNPPADKGGLPISVTYVSSTAPAKVREECYNKAIEDTIDFDPRTSKEVAECHKKRTEAYEKHLLAAGAKIIARVRRSERVRLETLDWKAGLRYRESGINDVEDCGNKIDKDIPSKEHRFDLSDPDRMDEYNKITKKAMAA